MKFENPKLKLLDAIDTSGDKAGLVKKVLLNKDISDGVKAKAVNRLTKNKISQGAKTSYTSTKNSKIIKSPKDRACSLFQSKQKIFYFLKIG